MDEMKFLALCVLCVTRPLQWGLLCMIFPGPWIMNLAYQASRRLLLCIIPPLHQSSPPGLRHEAAVSMTGTTGLNGIGTTLDRHLEITSAPTAMSTAEIVAAIVAATGAIEITTRAWKQRESRPGRRRWDTRWVCFGITKTSRYLRIKTFAATCWSNPHV